MKTVNQMKNREKIEPMISVQCVSNTIFLSPPEITCMVGEGNYTYIHTSSGKKYLVSKTIKNLHSHLNENVNFIRVHKSYLINTSHITNYINQDRVIKMTDGKEVYVSRRKSKEVKQILANVL